MKLIRFILVVIVFFLMAHAAVAQEPRARKTVKQYIEEFREDAIREMHEDGIPASITLAQGIQESNAGNSPLAIYANNHFGIKCQKDWEGPSYIQDDDTKDECFRKYETVFDSYSDHSQFLKSRPRYAFLFQIDKTDYKSWANGLKAAGYATDPLYAKRLIKIIEDNELYALDTVKPISPELIASVDNYFAAAEKKPHKTYTAAEEKYELPYAKRSVELINGCKCVHTRTGETIDEIGKEYNIDSRLLCWYNEVDKQNLKRFKPGQIIYLEPKKNKAAEEFHTIANGETMYAISQKYGIKLSKLYKKNHLKPGTEPAVGEKIWLRKKKKG